MKNTAAVIFPDTVPSEQVLFPLVLVFEPVVYCQPVENDDTGETLDKVSASMVDKSLCTKHFPAPLNENRDRFVRLVQDLQTRPDDYAAQLAHVSLAGISSGTLGGDDPGSAIVGNLLAKSGIESEKTEMLDKLLWQARLILKLGEQHDVDQKKMAEEMGRIKAREDNLFSNMVHEDETPFELTGKLSALTPDSDRMLKLRRKAWTRLFAFGPLDLHGQIFISPDTDAVDLLCEEFERQKGFAPDKLAQIPLPACSGSDEYFDRLQNFKNEKIELLQSVFNAGVKSSPFTDELLDNWNIFLEDGFPAASYGRSQLSLYRFEGVRVKQFFLDSFGHDEDELEANLTKEDPANIIIGVLDNPIKSC